jgi:hypothetical protein
MMSELLQSTLLTLLESVPRQHLVTDDNLVDHLSELLNSTPLEHALAQGNSQNPTKMK